MERLIEMKLKEIKLTETKVTKMIMVVKIWAGCLKFYL